MKYLVSVIACIALAACFGPVTTGDVESDVKVAEMYERGTGVPQNTSEAIRRYIQAAKAGSPKAQFRLGVLYFEGVLVPQDLAESTKWFEAASDEIPQAKFNLANAYRGGYGVDQSYQKALSLYKEVALTGYAPAAHNAGAMFGNGEGTPQNYAEAYLWLHLSSKLGLKEDETYKNNFKFGLPSAEVKKIEAMAEKMLQEIKTSSGSTL